MFRGCDLPRMLPCCVRTRFSLCMSPKVELTGIIVENAKVMTSKKLPVRVDFVNSDPHAENFRALFKCGDELRQDLLTLQVLGVMERLWLDEGFESRMNVYACTSVGDQLGFIEWVTESETVAHIQHKYGGKTGAFNKTVMMEFLKENNEGEKALESAKEDFIQSCAAYCVATFCLGIGDRHSDNIMVKGNGQLFHIDFGHFLGNFKSKMGIQRERSAFVFTPEMAYVMGTTISQMGKSPHLP